MVRIASADETYLHKLQDYYAEHRVFPSYASIGGIVGLKSTSSVSALLHRLRDERFIEIKDRRIAPLGRFFARSVMSSRVAAGLPSTAFDGPQESLDIDAYLVRHPSRTFLIQVKGESMSGAGLMPGDTVIVESRYTADPGEIVIAIVEGAYTIKRLARERRRWVLQPENPDYPVLRPEPLEIVGVVVGSFRRYD